MGIVEMAKGSESDCVPGRSHCMSIPSPATIREASKRKPCNGFGLAGLFVYSRPNLKTSAFAKNNSADELADRL